MSSDTGRQELNSEIWSAVSEASSFVRLTLTGPSPGAGVPWVKVSVRPVEVGGRRTLQFSYFTETQHVAKNADGPEAKTRFDEVLAASFRYVHCQTTAGDIHARVTKRGKVLVSRGAPSEPARAAALRHDRAKQQPLSPEASGRLLEALGMVTRSGVVKPSLRGKFAQINEFLRVIEQAVCARPWSHEPVRVLDCGCGLSYLTFAAYHYLNDLRGLPVHVTGVDANADVVAKSARLRDRLGWDGMEFRVSAIADYVAEAPPDVVLSLHACDTATDEAIARGVGWGSAVILAAPCCQHELHHQLHAPSFRPVTRHGILRERLADILTDAFRAVVLRIMGYRADVVEFVSPEATSKNLLIRGEAGLAAGNPEAVREYQELKAVWGVTPALEGLVGERLQRFLAGR